jgi:hypothetical protein
MPVGPMQFGTLNNAGPDKTTLIANNLSITFQVENPGNTAITAQADNIGVHATANPESELGTAVLGDKGRTGVFGIGRGRGVLGDSFSNGGGIGDGVQGRSDVLGSNAVFGNHFGNGVGVRGLSSAGFGVFGRSVPNVGVGGSSDSSFGVQGQTTGSGFAGAFFGRTAVVGNLAVFGSLTVVPPGGKSMAMPHPDGSYRRLYTLESPESWFEDFGSGRLQGGRARVELDPEFATVVQLDAYHVFLTPEGDCRGLYVSRKDSEAFEVREQQGGSTSVAFSYRVVARRRELEGERRERFERVDLERPVAAETAPPATEVPEAPSPENRS